MPLGWYHAQSAELGCTRFGSLDDDVYQLVGDGDDADDLFRGDGLLGFRVGQGELFQRVLGRAERGVNAAAEFAVDLDDDLGFRCWRAGVDASAADVWSRGDGALRGMLVELEPKFQRVEQGVIEAG